MSKCPFCGRENAVGVELCKGCGAKLVDHGGPLASAEPFSDQDAGQSAPEPDSLEEQVLAELQAGKKISAIKFYREQTGVGLKEAKDAVEALARTRGIASERSGCAGALLLLVLVSGGIVLAAL
ncbi:MAG: ribosomal protein L7/L12 [Pirellulales bacterium]|nr:ribosomal protein L7/L12 [Pirellulales bacterium]